MLYNHCNDEINSILRIGGILRPGSDNHPYRLRLSRAFLKYIPTTANHHPMPLKNQAVLVLKAH